MLGTSIESAGGISSVVNVYRGSGLFEECSIEYIPTHVDGPKVRKLKALTLAYLRCLVVLLSGSVAAVHAHTASRSSFWRKYLFFLLARAFHKPYIFHLHGGKFNKFYWEEVGPVRRRGIRYVLDNVHAIIVLSERWKQDLSRISQNHSIVVVNNPVMLPDLGNAAKVGHSVLYLGFLERMKGIYDLLRAIKLIYLDFPGIHVIVGGTGESGKVSAFAAKLGLTDAVNLLGWIRGDEKEACLRKAEVFVLTSYDEGLPMSLLEAMSYGLPVITTPVGGIPEVVNNGVEGFIVQSGDVEAIARALSKLLANPEMRKQMGEAGRKRIEKCYTPGAIFPVLKSIYQEIDST